METNGDKRLQHKYAFLGGHQKTIERGAILRGDADTKELDSKIADLSRQFAQLYEHYGYNLETTCRVWNQGYRNRMGVRASGYWKGIRKFKAEVERDSLNR